MRPTPERTILASDDTIALTEVLDGDKAAVDAQLDHTWDLDPDDRPVPFQLTRSWATIVDAASGELLGMVSWRPVPHYATLASTSWNLGIDLVPSARGRGLGPAAGLLLARHLFATTSVDRVQAITDVANVPGRRGLEKAGFHREGVLRGVSVLRGQRRDGVLYSLLRTDLNW